MSKKTTEEALQVVKDNRAQFNAWWCETCGDGKEYSQPEIVAHLKDAHGVDAATTKGTKQMVMHLDGRSWFQTNYAVTIAGVRLSNVVRCKRAKDDPMGY